MIATYKRKSNIFAAVCGVAVILGILSVFVYDRNTWVDSQDLAQFFIIIGGIAFYSSIWAYLKAKGRSGYWVLLVICFLVIGLVIILFLRDKSVDIKTALVVDDGYSFLRKVD